MDKIVIRLDMAQLIELVSRVLLKMAANVGSAAITCDMFA
jgi:hypothetical protein